MSGTGEYDRGIPDEKCGGQRVAGENLPADSSGGAGGDPAEMLLRIYQQRDSADPGYQ